MSVVKQANPAHAIGTDVIIKVIHNTDNLNKYGAALFHFQECLFDIVHNCLIYANK
jgi:hypothetical protein